MKKVVRLLSSGSQIDFVVKDTGLLFMYCDDDEFVADFDYEGVGVLIETLEELRKDMRHKGPTWFEESGQIPEGSIDKVFNMRKGPRIVIPTFGELEEVAEDLLRGKVENCEREAEKKSEPAVSKFKDRMAEEMQKAMAINADRQGKQDEDFLTFEKKAKAWQELNKPKK